MYINGVPNTSLIYVWYREKKLGREKLRGFWKENRIVICLKREKSKEKKKTNRLWYFLSF